MGKCISFSLAFPGAKLYIRKLANAIGIVSKKGEIQMLSALRKKIEFWRLLYPLFFHASPFVTRLFIPAVGCLQCHYPNEKDFRFCQRCGYKHREASTSKLLPLKVPEDMGHIEKRKKELRDKHLATPCMKQKSGPKKERSWRVFRITRRQSGM
ncbi:hypothetical protein pdam_00021791 [Pocillopora damicornis]|uniref:Uncharacterized protein n=1 Tax=Pocillopora damicornis TaxID=46731 RepID=A0A3M6UPF5_POCDA|nr:hypothetical protein pdam_00021791 [Pocillopora damicornis]